MAMQPDIQYVSFYMDGSAAKQMEHKLLHPAAAPKPKSRKKLKRRVVLIDPAAVLGIIVAAVMLLTMTTAVEQYREATCRREEMTQYIQQLRQENAQLQQTYQEGYDLDQIRDIAMAVGMVPVQEAEHISIQVQIPAQEQRELTFWEKTVTFLAGLFA